MDERNSREEALVIKNGKISFVGPSAEAMEHRDQSTEIIELNGRTAMPGFIDAHVHFVKLGVNMLGINLKTPDIKSINDIKKKVKEQVLATRNGKWIRGWGYDHSKLAENRHPTRRDLDEVSPEKPVVLTRTCGHIAVANSKALELAGISEEVNDPPGGKFGRENNKLNGVLYEAAQDRILEASDYSFEEYKEGVRVAANELLKNGITSVHDEGIRGRIGTQALLEACLFEDLPIRVYLSAASILGSKLGDYFLETGLITGFGNSKIRIGAYKVMIDGSSSGPTCATREPYSSDPENTGILYYTQEELNALVEKAYHSKFQISAHCVGDKAIEMMLNALEKVYEKYPSKKNQDIRPRIEHCAICPPDLVSKIKKLHAVPIVQPAWFNEFGDGYLRNYGKERVENMFPMNSFIKNKIIVAMSTDSPVTSYDPFMNLYEAITRVSSSCQSCGQNETIGLDEALRAYTFGGAYASFQENELGSLEEGKFADVIVLSRNIMQMQASEIKDTKVDFTIFGGMTVYQRKD